jgi:hypothetical protein
VQNRNRGANTDNLTASAGPITNAAQNDFTADLEQELFNVGTKANYRVSIELLGPGSSCSRVKVCSPEQTGDAIGVCKKESIHVDTQPAAQRYHDGNQRRASGSTPRWRFSPIEKLIQRDYSKPARLKPSK